MGSRLSWTLLAGLVFINQFGCSCYLVRPVTFTIKDAETGRPIEGANVDVSYLVMMDFGLLFASWGPRQGVTDRDGKLTLVVDPWHSGACIGVKADGYQDAGYSWGSQAKYLKSRKWPKWGNDCIVEMYAEPKATLELVFRKSHRGVVLVKFAGTATPPTPPGLRHFSYPVPPTGIVEIKESGLFERPEMTDRIKAWYENGQSLPIVGRYVEPSAKNLTDDAIALRQIAVFSDFHTWAYVLGTKAEASAIEKRLWPDGNNFDDKFFKRLSEDPTSIGR
jgi:hypothetical protein